MFVVLLSFVVAEVVVPSEVASSPGFSWGFLVVRVVGVVVVLFVAFLVVLGVWL